MANGTKTKSAQKRSAQTRSAKHGARGARKKQPARRGTKRGIHARYPWKEEPNPYFELRRSAIQGTGAFATRTIRKGTRIIEYLGQRISWRTADKRYDDEKMSRHHTFLFTVDDRVVIDAGVDGNDARFINHSCDPNCEAVNERKRIFIEAVKTIPAGTELVYDYQYERMDDHTEEDERFYQCRCGSPKCRGSILAPTKSDD
jgi:SET domain-containing protein